MPTDHDNESEFVETIAAWKKRHGLRDDDPILLGLELLRIHQAHWEENRAGRGPDDVQKLSSAIAQFNRVSADLQKGIQQNQKPESGSWPFVIGAALGVLVGFYLRRILL